MKPGHCGRWVGSSGWRDVREGCCRTLVLLAAHHPRPAHQQGLPSPLLASLAHLHLPDMPPRLTHNLLRLILPK